MLAEREPIVFGLLNKQAYHGRAPQVENYTRHKDKGLTYTLKNWYPTATEPTY